MIMPMATMTMATKIMAMASITTKRVTRKTPLLSFDVGSAIWNLVIFLCVLAILSKFVWPSVLGGLQAREEKIREDLQAAEKANSDAKALLADYQAKLDEAASQVQTMLADARRDADAAGQKIVAEAKEEAAATTRASCCRYRQCQEGGHVRVGGPNF